MSEPWTPGPWHQVTNRAWRDDGYIRAEGDVHVAYVRSEPRDQSVKDEQRDANIRLIAAAPEMAELLENLSHMLSDGPNPHLTWNAGGPDPWTVFRECRALLSRVRGET